jgi:hypothetical protein
MPEEAFSATNLPTIFKQKTIKSLEGHILEDKIVRVDGRNLAEVKKVFKQIWKEA